MPLTDDKLAWRAKPDPAAAVDDVPARPVPDRTVKPASQSPVHSRRVDCAGVPVSITASCFTGSSGVREVHLILQPTAYGSADKQLQWLDHGYQHALNELGMSLKTAVFRRVFCSDQANQARNLARAAIAQPRSGRLACAVSVVCEPPPPPAKVALWAYHVEDPRGDLVKTVEDASLIVHRGDLRHCWTTGISTIDNSDPARQTRTMFERYDEFLRGNGMNLADHAVRTWIYVRNIDADYPAMVKARRDYFAENGLTADTHFIASTGIQGATTCTDALVSMDAYTVGGLQPPQVRFLNAPAHLGPAHQYGSTFERGTAIAYQDRIHVLLSGTASIDTEGNIVHPGNVLQQLDRTLENAAELLGDADATLGDVLMWIVYVRDPSDAGAIAERFDSRAESTPRVIVTAPVCRPGWLVEVEGIAVVPASQPTMPPF